MLAAITQPGTFKSALLAFLGLLLLPCHHSLAQTITRDLIWLERGEGPIQVTADRLTARQAGDFLLLEGQVRLEADGLTIRAERMEIFTPERRAVLQGSVQVLEGSRVVLADRLELDRRASSALLERATILYKKEVTPGALRACPDGAALEHKGYNAIRLDGASWKKEDGRYLIQDAQFTLCDCGPDEEPTWSVAASEADVVPDERAWLTWPVLKIKGLGVFGLPVAYLPLSERRTGLLMPQFNYSGRDGVNLSESLFITLGEHADTTLSLDWIEERGFRQRLELRATPVQGSWFRGRLSHLDDEQAAIQASKGIRAGRHRYTAELEGRAGGPVGLGFRTQVQLFSDSDLVRDLRSGLTGRAAEYSTSAMSLFFGAQDQLFSLDSVYRQDLRLAGVDLLTGAPAEQVDLWGMDPVGDTIQRLGAFSWRFLPSQPFGWPLFLGFTVEGANLSSLQAAYRDWGADGTPDPREPMYAQPPGDGDRNMDNGPFGEGNGTLDVGELRRAFRLRFEPEVRWPLTLGRYLQMETRLAHRQLVYLPHGPAAPAVATRGISFAGFHLASELSRAYGQGPKSLGHVIQPFVELVGAMVGLKNGQPAQYLDLHDRLLSDGFQMRAGFETALFKRAPRFGFVRLLRLRLAQGLDMTTGQLAQLEAALNLDRYPFRLGLWSLTDWQRKALAEADGSLSLYDRRGDQLRLSYLYLPSVQDAGGPPMPLSQRSQGELDLLFGMDRLPLRSVGDGLHVLGLSARLKLLWGFGVRGGVNLNLRSREVNWYGAGLSYSSPCRCFGVALAVSMYAYQDLPDFSVLLDLGMLGRARGGTATRF